MVAEKLFSIVPSAADPERLFSELGRLVTKGQARLAQMAVFQIDGNCCLVSSKGYQCRQKFESGEQAT
jgi:hypothetical protein